ncbi:G-protein coupled receptor 98 [Liparis tanakae]|uniref:G-protein coupled receptor 98 n=1 Tax=Liparis tanakae TaxID=230148 RepID=A0A4Z2EGR2_9TELE|nr:G-protein coupled receptor 98 [Liparis tanakae]
MCVCVCVCVCVFQVSADWERTSLQPGRHPSSVFKASPVMGGAYTPEGGGFTNSNLVIADEESQEFDDLIFALKTGGGAKCGGGP